MSYFTSFILTIVGFLLILPALIFSLFYKKPQSGSRPWDRGLVGNLQTAYLRYDTASWIRRLKTIWNHPIIVFQYIKVLLGRKKLKPLGLMVVDINLLVPQHLVEISHAHHRLRVEMAKSGEILSSRSPIIVVDNVIHDGHHRIAAYKEAGVQYTLAMCYTEV